MATNTERAARIAADQLKTSREAQGLSVEDMAERLGVSRVRYYGLEQRYGSRVQRLYAERIKAALAGEALSRPVTDLSGLKLASVADEIREVGARLARVNYAPPSMDADELLRMTHRRALIFASRYGASGPDQVALQTVGDQFGITKERVRQIVWLMTRSAQSMAFVLPVLDRLRADMVRVGAAIAGADFEAAHNELLGGVSLKDAGRFAREVAGAGLPASL